MNLQEKHVKSKIECKIKEEDLNDMIDSTLFVQSLALCSLEIYFSEPQPNVLEKVLNYLFFSFLTFEILFFLQIFFNFDQICFFFELINYSDGRKKVQKELGHTK